MPTKAKTTKSRTSNNKKASKLKWWYILPVIVIVAIAGYAIVRFSEAATRPSSSTFFYTVGSGVRTFAGTQDKQGYGRGAKAPAFAFIDNDASKNTNKICSRIIGTGPGQGELSVAIRNGGYGKVSTPFSIQGSNVVCVNTNSNLKTYPLEIRVKQTGGNTVYVVNMYGVK